MFHNWSRYSNRPTPRYLYRVDHPGPTSLSNIQGDELRAAGYAKSLVEWEVHFHLSEPSTFLRTVEKHLKCDDTPSIFISCFEDLFEALNWLLTAHQVWPGEVNLLRIDLQHPFFSQPVYGGGGGPHAYRVQDILDLPQRHRIFGWSELLQQNAAFRNQRELQPLLPFPENSEWLIHWNVDQGAIELIPGEVLIDMRTQREGVMGLEDRVYFDDPNTPMVRVEPESTMAEPTDPSTTTTIPTSATMAHNLRCDECLRRGTIGCNKLVPCGPCIAQNLLCVYAEDGDQSEMAGSVVMDRFSPDLLTSSTFPNSPLVPGQQSGPDQSRQPNESFQHAFEDGQPTFTSDSPGIPAQATTPAQPQPIPAPQANPANLSNIQVAAGPPNASNLNFLIQCGHRIQSLERISQLDGLSRLPRAGIIQPERAVLNNQTMVEYHVRLGNLEAGFAQRGLLNSEGALRGMHGFHAHMLGRFDSRLKDLEAALFRRQAQIFGVE
ncbi:hypothetical protein HYFRA_00006532 [Hymenoscyphus fraxineus]|uniref:DUF7587 domain-containing protein n=1 Tax=Hymenoscyphus fraxineus TaxID=746836 RepID=A0A9N9KNR0_9HELO|nr:hypothetical protein HYFRA_00006532 [Hymenoscyphus fraxineus]